MYDMRRFYIVFILIMVMEVGICQSNFGTSIPSRIMTEIVSEGATNSNANIFVAQDVYVDGELFIRRGTLILNSVKTTERSGVGKPGVIEITAISTSDVNNNNIPLGGVYTVTGKSNKGKALGVGLGVGLGTILLPMLGFIAKKGESAIVKVNTVTNEFYIAQN